MEKHPTSGGIEVGYPMKDDAMQEQWGRIDLHGAAQEAVQDPDVPAVKAGRRVSISFLPRFDLYWTPYITL